MSRLEQQFGDVYRALAALPAAERQAAVERLVAVGLNSNGVTTAAACAAGVVERLDEQAWSLQEDADRGQALQGQYQAAFRRARAAAAALALAELRDLDDVAYEAVHSLPDDVDPFDVINGA